jgi:redox-sensitive bicupin YhaK (pirin superfamily)
LIKIYPKKSQAYGEFNNGEIIENKPIGFPQDNGPVKPYSNLFYWAFAEAYNESTIGLHPHKGFEIMSFVLSGSIDHYDTKINKWLTLKKGDVQLIKSGSGIYHSEKLHKHSSIFQIWFDPNISKSITNPPQYQDFKSNNFKFDGIRKYYVGNNSPIKLDSENIQIFKLKISKYTILSVPETLVYSIYCLNNSFKLNNMTIKKNDFIIICDEKNVTISVKTTIELFVISSSKFVSYKTYF